MDESRAGPKPTPVIVGQIGVPVSENGEVGRSVVSVEMTDEIHSVLPFYIPVGFFWMMMIWAIVEGFDDTIGCGVMVLLGGFIASIANLRLEFFKGFGLNIGISGVCSFFAFILGSMLFEPEGVVVVLILIYIFLSSTVLPVWLHKEGVHVRALGSAYAVPVCMFIIVFGFGLGFFGPPP